MFGMVVLFGLFHGLIFLPVMLSLIGPQSQPSIDLSSRNIAKEEDTFDNQEAKHLSIESPNHWQVLHVQYTATLNLSFKKHEKFTTSFASYSFSKILHSFCVSLFENFPTLFLIY